MNAHGHAAHSGSSGCNATVEPPGVDVGLTLLWAAAIVAMVILACIISGVIYGAKMQPANERSLTPLNGNGLPLPAGPRFEGIEMMSGPGENSVTAAAADRLKTYGWVDREKGIVRIPIHRAMELAIERGWLPSATAGKNESKAAPQSNSKMPDGNKPAP